MDPDAGSSHWTPLRRELLQWFNERVPGFADGYIAAVRLVQAGGFLRECISYATLSVTSTAIFQGHLGTAPRSTGGSKSTQSWLPLCAMCGRRIQWLDEGLDANAERLVSAQAYAAVERLVEKSQDVKDQASVGMRLVRALFRAVDRPADTPIPGWIFKAFDEEYKFFVKRAHSTRRHGPFR